MRSNLVGLVISALLHAGVIMLVINLGDSQPTKFIESISVPLTLAMFEPVAEPVSEPLNPVESLPELLPKPIIEAAPEVTSVFDAKPEPSELKVIPIPKAKPKKKKVVKKKTLKKKVVKKNAKPKLKKDPELERLAKAVMNPPQPVRPKPIVKQHSRSAVQKPVRQVRHIPRSTIAVQRQTRATKSIPQQPVSRRVTPQGAKPEVNHVQVGRAEAAYKARLKQLLNANKPYPKRAKRRGKQGRVSVSFIILRNGSIQNIRVVSSSGSSLLDNAALRAVKSISGKLPFPKEIRKSQWIFTVPVIYQFR